MKNFEYPWNLSNAQKDLSSGKWSCGLLKCSLHFYGFAVKTPLLESLFLIKVQADYTIFLCMLFQVIIKTRCSML